MIMREDFFSICNITIEEYFKHVHNLVVCLSQESRFRGDNVFMVYPHINAIVTRRPSSGVIDFLHEEFSLNTGRIRRVAAKVYVWLALRSLGILSQRCFALSLQIEGLDSLLVYPCNKKIRFFWFQNGLVDVFVKHGFSLTGLHRDIAFRRDHAECSFVHPIIDDGPNWYREDIVDGYSLARCKAGSLKDDCRHQVLECLKELQMEDMRLESSGSYARKLYKMTSDLISEVCVEKKLPLPHEDLLELIRCLKTAIDQQIPYEIPVSTSHGDLQEGNIWIRRCDNSVLIIDWETWSQRSVWYDYLLFDFGTRSKATMMKKLATYVESSLPDAASCTLLSPIHIGDRSYRRLISHVFLLEDILWELEETTQFPANITGFGLDYYLSNAVEIRMEFV